VTARSYLSIGDVLTLLRQEFPDVTISKIRFLESQGLVNPERTPSGYRKFYEHDVERLRWVLRQQREHFLPLKVIKDRLGDDAGGAGATPTAAVGAADAVPPVAARSATPAVGGPPPEEAVGHREVEPVLVGYRAAAAGRRDGPDADAGRSSRTDGPTLPGIETALSPAGTSAVTPAPVDRSRAQPGNTASVTVPSGPPREGASHPAPSGHVERAIYDGVPDGAPSVPDGAPSAPEGATSAPQTARSTRRARAAAGASPPAGPGDANTIGPRSSKKGPAARGGSAPGAAPPPPAATGDGISLSIDELSATCGLSVEVLRELHEFGLLSPVTVAGLEYYDETALATATLAAGFAQFGIEPRHLRLYKNAADREAGFVEQILLPLVRQRNPEARARARETADQLTGLGQQLRAALLRRALSDLLET
jgi:DNA-binding transcriptional MerR regulator